MDARAAVQPSERRAQGRPRRRDLEQQFIDVEGFLQDVAALRPQLLLLRPQELPVGGADDHRQPARLRGQPQELQHAPAGLGVLQADVEDQQGGLLPADQVVDVLRLRAGDDPVALLGQELVHQGQVLLVVVDHDDRRDRHHVPLP